MFQLYYLKFNTANLHKKANYTPVFRKKLKQQPLHNKIYQGISIQKELHKYLLESYEILSYRHQTNPVGI